MRRIFCDSQRRKTGSGSSFELQLPKQLSYSSDGECRFRIDDLRIPQVFPTISSLYPTPNHFILFVIGSTTWKSWIAEGDYSGTELAAAINKGLRGDGVPMPFDFANANTLRSFTNMTASYNVGTMEMTFTSSSDLFRIIADSGYGKQLLKRPLNPSSQDPTVNATSFVFTYVSRLGMDVLYLSSPTLTAGNQNGTNKFDDAIMQVNVTEPYGGVIDRSMSVDVWLPLPRLQSMVLEFSLLDRDGQVLQNVPSINFVITID
jgi:hypothetical protein